MPKFVSFVYECNHKYTFNVPLPIFNGSFYLPEIISLDTAQVFLTNTNNFKLL